MEHLYKLYISQCYYMNTNLDDIILVRDKLTLSNYQFWSNYLLQIFYPLLKFTNYYPKKTDQCITSAFSAFYLPLGAPN